MRIRLTAVGRRMPAWVAAGFSEYQQRLPAECPLLLTEVEAPARLKGSDAETIRRAEGERLLAAIPPRARVIALDVRGAAWSSEDLARRLQDWLMGGQDLVLLVGGPDGLDAGCLARAEARWSLSALTLPHMLVRVIVAEQLYRAFAILHGHPYHR
jgi:23S rRNA (pseudouridine1915-N3)-methyltransferase